MRDAAGEQAREDPVVSQQLVRWVVSLGVPL